jgi:hypothetical protein
MSHLDAFALRLASVEAEGAYLAEQRRLVGLIELAVQGRGNWPTDLDYGRTAELGREAARARRKYLDCLGVSTLSRTEPQDRIDLIHRLSVSERKWQPDPDVWLKEQTQKD